MKHDDLFTQLGLAKLSDQQKVDLSEELGGIAIARIAARLEALLTPEQMSAFETTLQTDEAAAFVMLHEYVPDYQQIAREEIEQLRTEITDTHAAVMKKLDNQ